MKKKVSRGSIYRFELVSAMLASYYVLFASSNDGFSGLYLGIPYSAYILFLLVRSHHALIRISCLCVVAIGVLLYVSDLSRNSFIYPIVGTSHILQKDTKISYSHYLNYIGLAKPTIYKEKPIFVLPLGTKIDIARQVVDGHPDFSTTYVLELNSEQLDRILKEIKENLKDNSRILNKEHDYKSDVFGLNPSKLYIHSYDIDALFGKTQGSLGYRSRLNNQFVFWTFYPVFYFPILALFLVALFVIGCTNRRNQKMADS